MNVPNTPNQLVTAQLAEDLAQADVSNLNAAQKAYHTLLVNMTSINDYVELLGIIAVNMHAIYQESTAAPDFETDHEDVQSMVHGTIGILERMQTDINTLQTLHTVGQ